MNHAYWEKVAADYEGEVLSVFDHDRAGCVQAPSSGSVPIA